MWAKQVALFLLGLPYLKLLFAEKTSLCKLTFTFYFFNGKGNGMCRKG